MSSKEERMTIPTFVTPEIQNPLSPTPSPTPSQSQLPEGVTQAFQTLQEYINTPTTPTLRGPSTPHFDQTSISSESIKTPEVNLSLNTVLKDRLKLNESTLLALHFANDDIE